MKLALTVFFMMLALCLVTGENALAWEDPNEGTGLDGGGGSGTDDDDHPWGGDGAGGISNGGTELGRNTSVAATVESDLIDSNPLSWLYEKFAFIRTFYFWKIDKKRNINEPVSEYKQANRSYRTSVDYRSRSDKRRAEK